MCNENYVHNMIIYNLYADVLCLCVCRTYVLKVI